MKQTRGFSDPNKECPKCNMPVEKYEQLPNGRYQCPYCWQEFDLVDGSYYMVED